MTMPYVGSLCTGIGGIDLGLERAGMEVRWQCEKDPYCRRVLAKHWPETPCYDDIRTQDWADVEPVDVVAAGFPCQPVSYSGARQGADDERWLWPEVARCLRSLRPRFVLLENVPGLLTLGFGEVAADLAALGYDFEWDCLPAAAFGAPHLRYRIFVVGYTDGQRLEGNWVDRCTVDVVDGRERLSAGSGADVADPEVVAVGTGLREGGARRFGWGRPGDIGREGHAWAVEPDVGRVAHGVPHRVDRLRALGNAVVPQVAEYVGRLIIEAAA